jgi:hypothetical protein
MAELVWQGPGVLSDGRGGTLYPGDRINETRHDPRQIQMWIKAGSAKYIAGGRR